MLFNSFEMYGVGEPSRPVPSLPCVVPFACPDRNALVWPVQNGAIFHPVATVNGGRRGRTQARRRQRWCSAGGREAQERPGWPSCQGGAAPKAEGVSLGALFTMRWGHLHLRAAHLEGGTTHPHPPTPSLFKREWWHLAAPGAGDVAAWSAQAAGLARGCR